MNPGAAINLTDQQGWCDVLFERRQAGPYNKQGVILGFLVPWKEKQLMRRKYWAALILMTWLMGLTVDALLAQGGDQPGADAGAQKSDAPMVADEKSQTLLDQWEEKEYFLAGDGIESGSLIMDCFSQSVFGRMSSRAQYLWKNGEGQLYWDDAQAGAMMERQGWSKEMLDFFFEGRSGDGNFDGCTLTAEDVGDRQVIHIEGPSQVRQLIFTPDGVLREVILEMPMEGDAEPLSMGLKLEYQRLNGHWMARSWTLEMALPEMGELVQTMQVDIGMEGRYHVMRQARSETFLEGVKVAQMVVRLGNWRLVSSKDADQ